MCCVMDLRLTADHQGADYDQLLPTAGSTGILNDLDGLRLDCIGANGRIKKDGKKVVGG